MAVKLEGTIRRYAGLSTDDKPFPAVGEVMPVGSSFMETNTGKIYRWNGEQWSFGISEDESLDILIAILLEIRKVRLLLEVATAS